MEEREQRYRQEADQRQSELLQQIQHQQRTHELLQQQIQQQNLQIQQQNQQLMNYIMSQNQMTSPPGSGPSTIPLFPSFMVSG